MVDGDKVREERQNVLDLKELTLLQELHRLLNVILLAHHVFRCKHKHTASHNEVRLSNLL